MCITSILYFINTIKLEIMDEEDKYGDLYEDGIDERIKEKDQFNNSINSVKELFDPAKKIDPKL